MYTFQSNTLRQILFANISLDLQTNVGVGVAVTVSVVVIIDIAGRRVSVAEWYIAIALTVASNIWVGGWRKVEGSSSQQIEIVCFGKILAQGITSLLSEGIFHVVYVDDIAIAIAIAISMCVHRNYKRE